MKNIQTVFEQQLSHRSMPAQGRSMDRHNADVVTSHQFSARLDQNFACGRQIRI